MSDKKTVSVLIPCYNEEENVVAICEAVREVIQKELPEYNYEIVFIDNKSTDKTRILLQGLCAEDKCVKAIFNSKNFGQFNSPYYGLLQTTGDCAVSMSADFQDPPSMIPKFVHEWEQGYKVVCAIKTSSKESHLMYFLRSCYYKTIKKMSSVEQIEHFTGFGLYDHSFIETLRKLDDSTPFMRGIVAELGPDRKDIPFEQPKRRAGKTHNNWYTLYDAAMLSFTSYTKIGLRLATLVGFLASGISCVVALVYLIMKLVWWNRFIAGTTPILIGVFLMGGIQLMFIGLLGEYILSMNQRLMHRPLVVEEKRFNFEEQADEK